MIKVAVTELEYRKAQSVFSAASKDGIECLPAPTADADLAAFVRKQGAQHVIVGVDVYAGPLYDALPRGGVIARFGVGHDGVNKELATQNGLFCTNTPGVLDDSVAELAIALMLIAARHMAAVTRTTADGQWTPRVGRELLGKTLAIIGCGAIGRRVAQIAARGLGMNVVGCEPAQIDARAMSERFGFTRICKDFAESVAGADYVSLHIPSLPATAHFMNADRLARIAPQTWLVNTARGAVVDEAALYDALAAGRLGGAALDVFEREPYQPVQPGKDLRTLNNVVMTPHVGSSTQEACDRMAAAALNNIRLACAGQLDGLNLLNPAVRGKKNDRG
ncbi:MAG TPA: NAD(P)-dependent oxidoreductase [Phycisphaerae bacterium]|nr:NAD(P)-dependent oxidoreductase [Phycisphaerae bacterium]